MAQTLEQKRAYRQAYYQANRDRILGNVKAYRKANPEKVAACHAAHYASNRERIAAQQKAYYQANRESQKAYRAANRERYAALNKAWIEANRDHVQAYAKARYDANRDQLLAKRKAYRAAHLEQETDRGKAHYAAKRDQILAANKAWREANSERRRTYRAANVKRAGSNTIARRTRVKGQFVEFVDYAVVFKRDKGRCQCETCYMPSRKIGDEPWHIDHIVPIVFGGPHSYANVRLAHATCNLRRGAARGETLQLVLVA